MGRLFDNLGGLWQLLRLAALSGFRLRGAYWQWRMSTAFGTGRPGRTEMFRSVLEYGRWMHQTRRAARR